MRVVRMLSVSMQLSSTALMALLCLGYSLPFCSCHRLQTCSTGHSRLAGKLVPEKPDDKMHCEL